jgi:hypothetical protein
MKMKFISNSNTGAEKSKNNINLKTDKMRTKTAVKLFKVNSEYIISITSDHLDGYRATEEDIKKVKGLGLTDFFELYDDDDMKYYSGYANLDLMAEKDLDEFDILNIGMSHAGCTYMKTRSKNGKMEMV